jgi:hypothetical protein
MPPDVDTPEMREARCPYCEREVLAYEDAAAMPPVRLPSGWDRMRSYVWPDEEPSPSG